MSLTQQQLDILAQGGTINFGLPADPGVTSAEWYFLSGLTFSKRRRETKTLRLRV